MIDASHDSRRMCVELFLQKHVHHDDAFIFYFVVNLVIIGHRYPKVSVDAREIAFATALQRMMLDEVQLMKDLAASAFCRYQRHLLNTADDLAKSGRRRIGEVKFLVTH